MMFQLFHKDFRLKCLLELITKIQTILFNTKLYNLVINIPNSRLVVIVSSRQRIYIGKHQHPAFGICSIVESHPLKPNLNMRSFKQII